MMVRFLRVYEENQFRWILFFVTLSQVPTRRLGDKKQIPSMLFKATDDDFVVRLNALSESDYETLRASDAKVGTVALTVVRRLILLYSLYLHK